MFSPRCCILSFKALGSHLFVDAFLLRYIEGGLVFLAERCTLDTYDAL